MLHAKYFAHYIHSNMAFPDIGSGKEMVQFCSHTLKKNKWTYIFWYTQIYRNWSNLTRLFSWFFIFSNKGHKINKNGKYIYWTKLIYIHFLHHAIRLTTGKNQCLWTCLLVCMPMACNCYQRRFTTQKYLHRLSFDKFPEIIML